MNRNHLKYNDKSFKINCAYFHKCFNSDMNVKTTFKNVIKNTKKDIKLAKLQIPRAFGTTFY